MLRFISELLNKSSFTNYSEYFTQLKIDISVSEYMLNMLNSLLVTRCEHDYVQHKISNCALGRYR